MIAFLGNGLLWTSLLMSLASIALKDIRLKKIITLIYSFTIFFAFLCLLTGFIISDFSIKNVFLNSSVNKPLIYKIAGSWSSHESSFLLWFSMLAASSSIYLIRMPNVAEFASASKLYVNISACVQIAFLLFIIISSNPFETFLFTPKDGLGMNPTLQDVAIAIHPPILYIGYVMSYPIFLYSLCIITYPDLSSVLLLKLRGALCVMMGALSAGIALGAWWAYRELGWGGYWFFDPVENISLLPWILGIVLYHFLMLWIRQGAYIFWTILCGISIFVTSLYALFFVRSGIVTSVHSFAFSPERGMFILAICLIVSFFSFGYFIHLAKKLKDKKPTGTKLVMIGNILWITSFAVLIMGITYPVIYSFIYKQEVAIDTDYYIKIFLPIFPIILLFNGFIDKLFKKDYQIQTVIFIFISAYAAYLILNTSTLFSVLSFSIISTSIYTMLASTYHLIRKIYILKQDKDYLISFFLGHFGFGLLAFAICMNQLFSSEIEFSGAINTEKSNDDLSVQASKISLDENEVYYQQKVFFDIQDGYQNSVTLSPENRLYRTENSLSQEVDIYSFITHDIYAVLGRVQNGIINAQIYYKPFISLIWLAAFMISSAFITRFLVGKKA